MKKIKDLLDGFQTFHKMYYNRNTSLYEGENKSVIQDLVKDGQKPRFAVVACSDSRVDPATVLQTGPGDIFVVRNVAALVPPYEEGEREEGGREEGGRYYSAIAAALQFAVTSLSVDHIIVIGHAHCGGVKAMVGKHIKAMVDKQKGGEEEGGEEEGGKFITAWILLLRDACKRAWAADPKLDEDALERASERQSVRLSLENLTTFPFIKAAVGDGRLSLHGWYFDISEGTLDIWSEVTPEVTPKRKFEWRPAVIEPSTPH